VSRRTERILIAIVLFTCACGLLACLGIYIPGIEFPFHLAVGWIPFLGRVLPQLRVRWDVAVSTAVYLVLLVVGAHLFLRWLYRETRDPAAGSGERRRWRLRWTLGGLAVVLLMFVAGTAAVGIVHQSVWLARSPKPIYRSGSYRANRIKCQSNLRQIGYGLMLYAEDHGGRYPDDLAELIRAGVDVTSDVFVCPASSDERAQGDTPEVVAAELLKPGHCSYVYFGKGIIRPIDPKRVVAVERADNHVGDEGVNVLFGNGEVQWLEGPKAAALWAELMRPTTTRPSEAATTQP
jgi:hypothetical protein